MTPKEKLLQFITEPLLLVALIAIAITTALYIRNDVSGGTYVATFVTIVSALKIALGLQNLGSGVENARIYRMKMEEKRLRQVQSPLPPV